MNKYNFPKIYIFGAGSRAATLAGYYSKINPGTVVEGFLVNEKTGCGSVSNNEIFIKKVLESEIFDICHKSFELDTKLPVFIATKAVYHEKLKIDLYNLGFNVIIPVTSGLDNIFRNEYIKRKFDEDGREFIKHEPYSDYAGVNGLSDLGYKELIKKRKVENIPSFCIYAAKSIYDKPVGTKYESPDYEVMVHAGSALTDMRFDSVELLDNSGENISYKNRQYCELTVLYWMWKNRSEDYMGLCQYRRHFIFGENWKEWILINNIDAVFPVPTCVFPNVDINYRERHAEEEWEYMLKILGKFYPDYYETAKNVYSNNIYFSCNMFIMKREALHNLCSWLFPIIDAVHKKIGKKQDEYLNRYPGFLSERLITLFFEHNMEKYKTAYADKLFLS